MDYKIISTIDKGFSNDQKYIIEQDDEKRILRVFNENQERRQQEFNILQQLEKLGATSLRAISIEEGKIITSFIEGQDADEVIKKLTEKQQYEIGLVASKDLQKIHMIQAPSNDWANYQSKKYERYVVQYLALGLHIDGDTEIMSFIDQRLHLLEGRPNVLLHDDFHLPNIIIKDGQYAGVIDFGRFDWGDPVWDFIKLGMFSSEKSPAFCKGVIEGYYGRKPDKHFWELYNGFTSLVPNWYLE